METSKSILARRVISVGDRKQEGEVRDFRIDEENGSVEYFIISDNELDKFYLLPFSRVLTIGDAFMAIQKESSLIPIEDENKSAKKKVEEGGRLVGLEAVASSGDRLGIVEDFEFDSKTGKILSLRLNTGQSFTSSQIMFFAETFVYIDKDASSTGSPSTAPVKPAAWDVDEFIEKEEKKEAPAAEKPAPEDTSDNGLRKFLLGSVLSDDVKSEDGGFSAKSGETITEDMLDKAEAHDALLLLTISVNE